MILYINTTDLNKLHFALINEKAVKQTKHTIGYTEHHATLTLLQKFLKQNKAITAKGQPKSFSAIIVCSGPGSFTGTRVGVTIAQALAFAWDIPIQAISATAVPKNLKELLKYKKGKKVEAEYNRPAY